MGTVGLGWRVVLQGEQLNIGPMQANSVNCQHILDLKEAKPRQDLE
jgi:hypothetical protein